MRRHQTTFLFSLVYFCVWWTQFTGTASDYGYGAYLYSDRRGDFNDCYDKSWYQTKNGDEVCMDGLGCFKLTEDFYHPQFRPCNVLPEPRSLINTRFVLFTKNNTDQGKFIVANDVTSLNSSGFDGNRQTKFIIHGLYENPLHDPWVLVMMKELLNHGDYNVIIVDWNQGSSREYVQAVANARVVAAEIDVLIKALEMSRNLKPSTVHLIGHGIGSHVAGYTGQRMSVKPSRITGLDPSYKFFCNMPESVRLDPSDGNFVDVIHTEFHGHDSGHGGCHELGHVDFFPNGGGERPGCNKHLKSTQSSQNHYHGYYEVQPCDQQRAVSLFISTLKTRECRMVGYWCRSYKAFLRGECSSCGDDGSRCAEMGIKADEYSNFRSANRSTMYLVIGKFPPFCYYEYRLRMDIISNENFYPSGNMAVALKGEKKPLFVHLSFYSLHQGKEYTFLVTTAVEIGQVKNVSIKVEEYDRHEEGWQLDHEVIYYGGWRAKVDKLRLTLLNDIGKGKNNRSPREREFCKSESTVETHYPGWTNYLPCT